VMAAPDLPVDILVISHLLPSDHSEFESSERPSSPDPHKIAVARWRERVAARPQLSVSSLPYSFISIPFTEIAATSIIFAPSTEFTATPHVLSTTPVHVTPTPITSTIPSQTSSVRPSRKRRRSPITSVTTTTHTPTALAPTRADLLLIHKRFRGSAFDYETSVEDGMESAAEAENIGTYIAADFEAHAQVGVEAESNESDGDMIEIGVDVVHPEPDTPFVFPVSTIIVRLVEHEEAIQGMCEHLVEMTTQRSLGDIKTKIHGIVRDEREARARIERHLGLVQEELR
ncbi:hypothetical protein Tco_1512131, partial [Tanacetum coccineum]